MSRSTSSDAAASMTRSVTESAMFEPSQAPSATTRAGTASRGRTGRIRDRSMQAACRLRRSGGNGQSRTIDAAMMLLMIAIIGAGPSGLAAARNLQRAGLAWEGFELADDVGGLWNIDAPRSTVYESAHLISSRTTTEFTEFPMRDSVADYPSHRELYAYFRDFADHFDLRRGFRFGTEVTRV